MRNVPNVTLKAHPFLLHSLLTGSTQGYIIPGSELEPFKKYLPKRGRISFLADHSFGQNLEEEKLAYDFQNYLSPLILNYEPGEKIGIIYCSGKKTAERRLAETGYEWLTELSDGKGIVQKKS